MPESHDKEIAAIVRGGMLIQHENSFIDQANILESEGVLDQMYALLAVGIPLGVISQNIALSVDRIKMILVSSPSRMRRWNQSRLFHQSNNSMDTLNMFKDHTFLLSEEASATRHHASMVKLANDALGREGSEGDQGNKIILNTQINYGAGMDVPELPPELKQVN